MRIAGAERIGRQTRDGKWKVPLRLFVVCPCQSCLIDAYENIRLMVSRFPSAHRPVRSPVQLPDFKPPSKYISLPSDGAAIFAGSRRWKSVYPVSRYRRACAVDRRHASILFPDTWEALSAVADIGAIVLCGVHVNGQTASS